MDTLLYIDNYYKGLFNAEEKKIFEQRILEDPLFANEVAFYLSTVIASKELHNEETKKRFREIYRHQTPTKRIISLKFNTLRKVAVSIAASVIILIGAYFIFFRNNANPQRLANTYIKEHLLLLTHTMGSPKDSMQVAIRYYNDKQYDSALQLFEAVSNKYPENSEAVKDIGLVHLANDNYDKALQQFDKLMSMNGLYSKHGKFLKAITLIRRNKEGDKEQAKQLLEQVVEKKEEGSKEAEEWLKKW